MTIEIALLISIVSVAFSVFFGLKKDKKADIKEIEERVKENTKINIKLDDIASTIKEIKEDKLAVKNEMNSHDNRITKVEESAKQAHHRLDTIESRLNNGG